MASLDKINSALSALELKHGASIPLADLRLELAAAFAASTAVSSAPVEGLCASLTKDNKQCSKKATKPGSDGKSYCSQHHAKLFGASPSTKPAAAAASSKPAAAKKASVSTGKGNPNPPCDHDVKGANPRKCGKGSKEEAGGQWYCTTHLKSHKGASIAAAGNNIAAAKISSGYKTIELVADVATGLAKDGNGIYYVEDYENNGPAACARLTANKIVDLTVEDLAFLEKESCPVLPAELRAAIIANPAESAKYKAPAEAEPAE